MSSVTSFSGLASGMDTGKIVDQLVAIERTPITKLQASQSNMRSVSTRFGKMRDQLDALRSAADALKTVNGVFGANATSSDSTSVGASSTAGAAPGRYAVSVTARASAERTYSNTFGSRSAEGLLGSGTLSIAVGSGDPVSISVGSSDTLDTVAARINADVQGVTAGVVFDGTSYRLQVSGNKTGAGNGITFTESGTTLGLDVPAHQVVAASDAVFTIDGLAMSRSTNVVTDAMPGVTLTLSKTTSAPVEIAVEASSDQLSGKIETFVKAYNDLSRSIDTESAYKGSARVGDSLAGDSTLRGLQQRMRAQVGSVLGGPSGGFDRLSAVGVAFQRDGSLAFDATKLKSALDKDPSAVVTLFAGSGATAGVMSGFDALADQYTAAGNGVFAMRMSSISTRIRSIDGQIERMELRIDSYETRLRAQFGRMEQVVSSLQSQGSQLQSILGNNG